MTSREEDLSALLEYSLQIDFTKLTNVIKGKAEAISHLNDEIEALRKSIGDLKDKKNALENTVADCQDQCQRASVSVVLNCS